MNRYVFTAPMFGKGAFDSRAFVEVCTPVFLLAVRRAADNALDEVMEYDADGFMSDALFKRALHERIFHNLRRNLQDAEFHESGAGNERLCFVKSGYIFILRLQGGSRNDTAQEAAIDRQEADRHIISLAYALDGFRSHIAGLSFRYVENGNAVFALDIPETAGTARAQEIEAAKPTLKTACKKKKAQ